MLRAFLNSLNLNSSIMTKTSYVQSADGTVYVTNNLEFWKDCKTLTKAEGAKLYKAQAITTLKKQLKPGDKVYTVLRHVSSSGMTRHISLFVTSKRKGEKPHISDITYTVSVILNDKLAKNGGIVVGGCGMDTGFHLVYSLGRSIWPQGTAKPHGTRNGVPDNNGGYALKHSWL